MADADQLMLLIRGSVRGPRHERAGSANEDAAGWRSGVREGTARLVAAVADGHGSQRCPRSATGADLAVSGALSLVDGELPAGPEPARQLLAVALSRWQEAVDGHLAAHPLDAAERAAACVGPAETTSLDRLAYGTTLLFCAVAAQECLIAQVGDGEVVAVNADGTSWLPLGREPMGDPDETDSLCLDGADGRARCGRLLLEPSGPELLMLVTDGCSNAYSDLAGLLQVATDLHGRIRAGGNARVLQEGVDAWLGRASEHSGDDASCVVIWTGTG